MSTDRQASRVLKDIEDHLQGQNMNGPHVEPINKLYAAASHAPPGGPVFEDQLDARDAIAVEAIRSLIQFVEPHELTPQKALAIGVAAYRIADAVLSARTLPPCEFGRTTTGDQPADDDADDGPLHDGRVVPPL